MAIGPSAVFAHVNALTYAPEGQLDLGVVVRLARFEPDREWACFVLLNNSVVLPVETSADGRAMRFALRMHRGENQLQVSVPVGIPPTDRLDDGVVQDYERYGLTIVSRVTS